MTSFQSATAKPLSLNRLLLSSFTLLLAAASFAEAGYVRGYTRKDGTYVAPYYRGSPGNSSTSTAPVGIPCGNTYISAKDTCHIGTTTVTPGAPIFANCADAKAQGFSDIPRGAPGYADQLDRDHDGIACEVSDEYDGTTWVNPPAIINQSAPVTPAPQRPGTEVKPSATCAGLQDIPSGSPFYDVALDPNHDGVACNAADYNRLGVAPQALEATAKAGVLYAKVSDLGALGSLSYYGDGKANLFVNSKSLTFAAGQSQTTEGGVLEAPPFYDQNVQLMVPLSSVKLANCSVKRADSVFTVSCTDGATAQGGISSW